MQGEEVEDDSLLTFEEDVEFDPLKRSGSDSVHRANSLSQKVVVPLLSSSGLPSQPPHLEPHLQTPPSVMPTDIAPVARDSSSLLLNPVTSSSTGGIGDLAGISLDKTTALSTLLSGHTPQKQQDSLSELFCSLHSTSSPAPQPHPTMPSSVGVASSYPQMVLAPPMTLGGRGQVVLGLQGDVAYAPGALPISYTAQAQAPQAYMYMSQVSNLC